MPQERLLAIQVGDTVRVTGAPNDATAIKVPLPSVAEQLRGAALDEIRVQLVFERVDGDTWRRVL